jgi:hypothetical protein
MFSSSTVLSHSIVFYLISPRSVLSSALSQKQFGKYFSEEYSPRQHGDSTGSL